MSDINEEIQDEAAKEANDYIYKLRLSSASIDEIRDRNRRYGYVAGYTKRAKDDEMRVASALQQIKVRDQEIAAYANRVQQLEGLVKELIPMAEDAYKLHVSNAVHQEFLSEDRELIARASKLISKEK